MNTKELLFHLIGNLPFPVVTDTDGEHAGIVLYINHKLSDEKLIKVAKITIGKHGNIPVIFKGEPKIVEKIVEKIVKVSDEPERPKKSKKKK